MSVENPSSDQSCVHKGLLLGVFRIHTPGPGKSVSGQGMAVPHYVTLYIQGTFASHGMLQCVVAAF